MSTRSSVHYDNGIHIFEEGNSGDLCFDIDGHAYKNDKYDVPAIKEKDVLAFMERLEFCYGHLRKKKDE